ncbi:Nramp family divalent metal transporter [Patiriisocius hiemis]|uniref:Nramp family divalent metal transporter n=1 Tax=Patiriisocius hiemis TaxID=3075604 RepID=A0ABU2YBK1_9FLAO|nr:Nramp family divalent metal transporter [Constantimarinum sp. W242]MDT0555014.1 Nramp family divalent metal transporter [Constantimarinum sp. W242]
MMKNIFKNIGPGTLVAAAFIGPGTVTVCTIAGVTYGFTLLWAMLVSIIATIVLQEMAMRLGLVGGKGLAETITTQIKSTSLRWLAMGLIIGAVLIGNAAYEAGNISGGVLGLETLIETTTYSIIGLNINYLSIIIGIIAFVLLYIGNYKIIERFLVGLVVIMSLSFLLTAIITKPNLAEIFKGLLMPKIPEKGILTIIALIGTTVVPYNLFLHASLVKEKWNGVADLKAARRDLFFSIILGGIVSIAIIITATNGEGGVVTNASDLAIGLKPLYGSFATYFLSIGLFAAGITSAITAPLAAAYVARGCFGWDTNLKSNKFRSVWGLILVLGVIFSSIGFKPITIITFAQVANGILLPVVAGFLIWIVNKKEVLGSHVNTKLQNIVGVCVVSIALLLGLRSLYLVFVA